MESGDIFFGIVAGVLLALVVRSFAGRVSSGNVAPRDLFDWREYAQMAVYTLVVLLWVAGPLLGLGAIGAAISIPLVIAIAAYVVLYFKTRNTSRNP